LYFQQSILNTLVNKYVNYYFNFLLDPAVICNVPVPYLNYISQTILNIAENTRPILIRAGHEAL